MQGGSILEGGDLKEGGGLENFLAQGMGAYCRGGGGGVKEGGD